MKPQYNLVSVCNGSHRAVNVHRQYNSAIRFADRSDSPGILPRHGIPMAARDTLLAQLLGSNGKTAAVLLSGKAPEASTYARLQYQIRDMKSEFRRTETARRTSPTNMAKASKSLVGALIGVEIECYPRNAIESSGLTDVTSDGSLRSGGREIRRITWLNSSGRLGGLLALKDKLVGARVDTTCGLHVHIDVRHLPESNDGMDGRPLGAAQTYDRLCRMYPVLKKLVPRSRWNNRYCAFNNNRPDSEDYRRPRNGDRYAAINWCSYSEHKTIEFRLAPGSTNLVKIESWALLCRYLVTWCSNPHNQVPTTWHAFLAILPEWLASWCVVRNMKLHGKLGRLDFRVGSAADFDSNGETVQ